MAVPSLDALIKAGFDVVAVLTRPDAPVGRKRVLTPSPVAARAMELGIEVIRAAKVDADTTAGIAEFAPDVAAIVAYGGIVPKAALGVPRHGWSICTSPCFRHGAVLPPVQRSIIAGDDVTGGAVTFQLEEGLDTGPVFGTLTETVRPEDTAGDLLERLSISGAVLLSQTLSAIDAGQAAPQPQNGGEISLAPKLTLDDGRLDWQQPALVLNRRARGVTPEPGAWTTLEGQRVKLEPVALRPEVKDLPPGSIRVEGKSVLVGTGSHAVELGRIQPAGKKMMSSADWAAAWQHPREWYSNERVRPPRPPQQQREPGRQRGRETETRRATVEPVGRASATPRAASETGDRRGASPITLRRSAPAAQIQPDWWLLKCSARLLPKMPTQILCFRRASGNTASTVGMPDLPLN